MTTTIKIENSKKDLFKNIPFGQWFYLEKPPLFLFCKIKDESTNTDIKYNTLCITNKDIRLFNFDADEEVIKIDSLEIMAK